MSIVVVNVTQQIAPTPSRLQQTGALVTQGGTTLSTGTYSLLTQPSDLNAFLNGPLAISDITVPAPPSVGSGIVTVDVTTAAPHGLTGTVILRIIGVTPNGFNGRFSCTVTGASTFTYQLSSNPGTPTVYGYYFQPSTNAAADELVEMVTTFFAQGGQQAVYVLELGTGSVSQGVNALTTFITASPQFFYAYVVPREWDGVSAFLSFLAGYESTVSKTYFFVTTTTGTYTSYTSQMKCVAAMVEAPSIGTNEFSIAAWFWNWLHYNPSSTNKITPAAFTFLFGVTPYPTVGNAALLSTLAQANINVVGTGAEGGIANTVLFNGTTLDGNDATYWYSVDWVQIQIDLQISNAVINGSNTPINPLYYNQFGLNRLQQVAIGVLKSAIAFGLATGSVAQTQLDGTTFTTNYYNGDYDDQCVINAVPFVTYNQQNPGDYKIGRYSGFAIIYIPQNGFRQIIFNVTATQFISAP